MAEARRYAALLSCAPEHGLVQQNNIFYWILSEEMRTGNMLRPALRRDLIRRFDEFRSFRRLQITLFTHPYTRPGYRSW